MALEVEGIGNPVGVHSPTISQHQIPVLLCEKSYNDGANMFMKEQKDIQKGANKYL